MVACGAEVSSLPEGNEPVEAPVEAVPSAVFAADEHGCAAEVLAETGAAALEPADNGADIAIVELAFAEELCTNAGGQYVIAREVDGFREFWLGGHACYFFPPEKTSEPMAFGVLRYAITAAAFEVPPEVCVGFPGEPPGLFSDSKARAVAVFSTLDEARRFAASIP